MTQQSFAVLTQGSLLNFEEEIEKVKFLPTQIQIKEKLINGVTGENGDKIQIKGFDFQGQTNGFTNNQLTKVIEDLIDKYLTFDEIQGAAKEFKTFTEIKDTF